MSKDEIKVLEGVIQNDYKWNPGTTVGRFLTNLRDNQELTAVRCTKTSKVFLPPQSWSPYGQIKMDRFVPVTGAPTLKAGTIVYQAPSIAPEDIKVPYMMATISYPGVDTELIHLVSAPEDKLKALKPGDELKPVFRETPRGNMRDLLYYEPV